MPKLGLLLSCVFALSFHCAAQIINVSIKQYDSARSNEVTHAITANFFKASDPYHEVHQILTTKGYSKGLPGYANAYDVAEIKLLKPLKQASIGIEFELGQKEGYRDSTFILLPGAAYNGNRFDWRRIAYSPKLLDPRDVSPSKGTIISDVPRLSQHGHSRIQERSGSMSFPAIGLYSPGAKSSYFIILPSASRQYGDYGFDVQESDDRKKLWVRIYAPLVREGHKYRITDSQFPTTDVPRDFNVGDSLVIPFKLYQGSPSIQAVYDSAYKARSFSLLGQDQSLPTPRLPLSICFPVQEKKFNEQNWVDAYGYYSVGMRENFLQDWQIGWTGGMISTYPLLALGSDETKKRVVRNFDWLFAGGISPSGFFWDSGEKGTQWYGGDIRKPHTKNWHLIRKSGDGLYYVCKQLHWMKDHKMPVKTAWFTGTKTVANAFVKLWREHGQFGQFVDSQTGDVIVGGSTSGAIAPAALLEAYKVFGDTSYLNVAKESGCRLSEISYKTGVDNGGPGDALQNPDSESAYALLHSMVSLYETTNDKTWLQRAESAATHFATWVMSYNYEFPKNSLFGRAGIKSKGCVLANTQNKHGAPGICTFSGDALLRLTQYTGDMRWANLLSEITRGLPQYMGHPANKLEKVKDGWMCERVSCTDWLEGIGEITYQSTWAETSLMLTTLEIPSVYWDKTTNQYTLFDHLEIARTGKTLTLKNPTSYPATGRILIKSGSPAKPMYKTTNFSLAPNQSAIIK